jgi:hypothetical protein
MQKAKRIAGMAARVGEKGFMVSAPGWDGRQFLACLARY